ncbi:hypothetical protein Taro_006590 [Colocasia esculenta]|uniref:Uncharacterized protein n=1 Tax=Colocasia esculenta TaxID=4460 RepID=A0A843TRN7_COLES|nr:hypothetical protein [Colocasia esculenta]
MNPARSPPVPENCGRFLLWGFHQVVTQAGPISALTLEMLEEKEVTLQKKISMELERAKEFTRTSNRQAAAFATLHVMHLLGDSCTVCNPSYLVRTALVSFFLGRNVGIFENILHRVKIHLKTCFTFVCPAAALQCLKRKKFYESQVEQLWDFQLRIHDQQQKQSQKHQHDVSDGCNK